MKLQLKFGRKILTIAIKGTIRGKQNKQVLCRNLDSVRAAACLR